MYREFKKETGKGIPSNERRSVEEGRVKSVGRPLKAG
jgi:hypothetical protein